MLFNAVNGNGNLRITILRPSGGRAPSKIRKLRSALQGPWLAALQTNTVAGGKGYLRSAAPFVGQPQQSPKEKTCVTKMHHRLGNRSKVGNPSGI
jgi:hypothetical protein